VSDPLASHRTQVIDFPYALIDGWCAERAQNTVQLPVSCELNRVHMNRAAIGFLDSVVWNPLGTGFGTPKIHGRQQLGCSNQLVDRKATVLAQFSGSSWSETN
jgi:hypothetical protein